MKILTKNENESRKKMKIFCQFLEHGYEPVRSLSVCRNLSRKDSIVFSPCEPKKGKVDTLFILLGDCQCTLFCGNISPAEEKIIEDGLKMWPYGIRKNEYVSKFDDFLDQNHSSYFVDFTNQPWSISRHQSSHGRLMLQAILVNLTNIGWRLLTSAKLTGECRINTSSENNEDFTTHTSSFDFGYSRGCHTFFMMKNSN